VINNYYLELFSSQQVLFFFRPLSFWVLLRFAPSGLVFQPDEMLGELFDIILVLVHIAPYKMVQNFTPFC
jgi:hypothetical protein